LEVSQIAQATGLPLRRIRYVLEHQVLPGSERASRGHRIARSFTGFEAFGIALSALLLEAGLRREVVARCLASLVTTPIPPRFAKGQCALLHAYGSSGPIQLELGDAVNLRLVASTAKGDRVDNKAWRQIKTGAEVGESYSPMVAISVEIGRLRDLIRLLER